MQRVDLSAASANSRLAQAAVRLAPLARPPASAPCARCRGLGRRAAGAGIPGWGRGRWLGWGYGAGMTVRLGAVVWRAGDPARLAEFWGDLLRREVVSGRGGSLVPGPGAQVSLRFVSGRAPSVRPNPMHLHLTSTSAADQEAAVTMALRLGASHLDVGQRADEGHIVLADPEGNEFCVIEPDNAYLAGAASLANSPATARGRSACSGARRWVGRWCGTSARRRRSSPLRGAPRSPGVDRLLARTTPRATRFSNSSPPIRRHRSSACLASEPAGWTRGEPPSY